LLRCTSLLLEHMAASFARPIFCFDGPTKCDAHHISRRVVRLL
jgi:hypothetical protein